MKWRVSQRKKRADGVTGQSDFYIPKENRNTVRSIESARAHTTHPKKSHKTSLYIRGASYQTYTARNCSNSREHIRLELRCRT